MNFWSIQFLVNEFLVDDVLVSKFLVSQFRVNEFLPLVCWPLSREPTVHPHR